MDKKLEKLIAEGGVSESAIYHEMASRPWRQQKNQVQEQKEDKTFQIDGIYSEKNNAVVFNIKDAKMFVPLREK